MADQAELERAEVEQEKKDLIAKIAEYPTERLARFYRDKCHLNDDFFCKLNDQGKERVLKFVPGDKSNTVLPCCVDNEEQTDVTRERKMLFVKLARMQDKVSNAHTVLTKGNDIMTSATEVDAKNFKRLSGLLNDTAIEIQNQLVHCLEPLFDSNHVVLEKLPQNVCEPLSEIVEQLESRFFPVLFEIEDLISTVARSIRADTVMKRLTTAIGYTVSALKIVGQAVGSMLWMLLTGGKNVLVKFFTFGGAVVGEIFKIICALDTDKKISTFFNYVHKFIAQAMDKSAILRAQMLNVCQSFTSAAGRKFMEFLGKSLVALGTRFENDVMKTEGAEMMKNATDPNYFSMPTKESRSKKLASLLFTFCCVSFNFMLAVVGFLAKLMCYPVGVAMRYFQRRANREEMANALARERVIHRFGGHEQLETLKIQKGDFQTTMEMEKEVMKQQDEILKRKQKVLKDNPNPSAKLAAGVELAIKSATKNRVDADFRYELANAGLAEAQKKLQVIETEIAKAVKELRATDEDLTSPLKLEIKNEDAPAVILLTAEEQKIADLQEAKDAQEIKELPELSIDNVSVSENELEKYKNENIPIKSTGTVVNILFRFFMLISDKKNDLLSREDVSSDFEKYRDAKYRDKTHEDIKFPQVPPYVRYAFCRSQPQYKEATEDNVAVCKHFRDDPSIIIADDASLIRHEVYAKQARQQFDNEAAEKLAIITAKNSKTPEEIRLDMLEKWKELEAEHNATQPQTTTVVSQNSIPVATSGTFTVPSLPPLLSRRASISVPVVNPPPTAAVVNRPAAAAAAVVNRPAAAVVNRPAVVVKKNAAPTRPVYVPKKR